MDVTQAEKLTVDEVVAYNLRRLRQGRYTRQQLANRLSEMTGSEVKRWRIIDLEGGRSKDRPPASASWSEISSLAAALGARIFDLVLPPENVRVWVSRGAWSEVTEIPEPVRSSFSGEFITEVRKSVSYGVSLDRDEASKLWFGLPSSYLTSETLSAVSEKYRYDTTIAERLEQITETQQQLLAIVGRQDERADDGIDS